MEQDHHSYDGKKNGEEDEDLPATIVQHCPICTGELTEACFPGSCTHAFCFRCIFKWAKIKKTCPLCLRHFEAIVWNHPTKDEFKKIELNKTPEILSMTNSDHPSGTDPAFESRRREYIIIVFGHRISFIFGDNSSENASSDVNLPSLRETPGPSTRHFPSPARDESSAPRPKKRRALLLEDNSAGSSSKRSARVSEVNESSDSSDSESD